MKTRKLRNTVSFSSHVVWCTQTREVNVCLRTCQHPTCACGLNLMVIDVDLKRAIIDEKNSDVPQSMIIERKQWDHFQGLKLMVVSVECNVQILVT